MCIRDSPKLGATGAAVATVVGQCVAAVVAFVCNHKFNHDIKPVSYTHLDVYKRQALLFTLWHADTPRAPRLAV